ncbi:MAG: multiheme c-type cytochrome [Polyangiaceae bacterium]
MSARFDFKGGLLVAIPAIAAFAACASAPPAPPPQEVAPPPSAPAAASSTAAAAPTELPLPGPAPRPPLAPLADIGLPTDLGCVKCHQEIAEEQASSLHKHAWQNGYFEKAYEAERTSFCRKCHAPSADPSTEPPDAAKEAGVGCISCHVVPQGIVGTRAVAAKKDGHAVLGDARLATDQACESCHQFNIPAPPSVNAGPMQDTLGEHARSAFADKPCQTCHMPLVPSKDGGTHRSHAFRVQGDTAMLAKAVKVIGTEVAHHQLALTLAPGDVGHAFPTGDLYRQVELRFIQLTATGTPIGAPTTYALTRKFEMKRHQPGNIAVNHPVSDTRLTAQSRYRIPLAPDARKVKWQIVWQRLPAWLAESMKMNLRDHETVVLEGTVPVTWRDETTHPSWER